MAIQINRNLKVNAFNDPTKETINKSISQICNEMESGAIIMPIFQRDLAWTTVKKVELFNFQLNGQAPVSPISMNKIGRMSLDMPHVTLMDRIEVSNDEMMGRLSVIDGQQRISTNYQAFTNNETIRSIVLDITRGKFVDLKDMDVKKNQIPVGILYNKNPDVFTNYIKEHPVLAEFDVSSLLGQIRTKFSNYFYTVNYAQDLPGEKQINWFDVLNLAGSRVPDVQMKLTRLQVKGLDFYKEYTNIFRDKLEEHGLDHLFVQKNTEVSIPLATLNPAVEIISEKQHSSNYSPMASDRKDSVTEMSPNKLRETFKLTLDALDQALGFIDSMNLPAPDRIDKLTYLTGYFVWKKGLGLTETNKENLLEWYETVSFGNKSNQARRDIFTDLLKKDGLIEVVNT